MDILKQSAAYVMASKRRLLKVVIYAIYLYLFFKRFAFVIKYFRNLIRGVVTSWLSHLSLGDNPANFLKRLSGKTPTTAVSKRLRLIRFVYRRLAKATLFCYNAFIFVQLCCIGYAESFRIKTMLLTMLNSVKSIRIKDASSRV